MKKHFGRKVIVAFMALLMVMSVASTALAAPQNWGASGGFLRTERGDKGNFTRTVQRVLQQRGYSLSVDGDFGPTTEDRVIRFQRTENIDDDGIVGSDTWGKLYNWLRYSSSDYAYYVSGGDGFCYFDYDYSGGPWWIRQQGGSWDIIMY